MTTLLVILGWWAIGVAIVWMWCVMAKRGDQAMADAQRDRDDDKHGPPPYVE